MGSTNDVLSFGSYDGNLFSTTALEQNIRGAIKNLKSRDPNIQIFIVLPPMISNPNSQFYKSNDPLLKITPQDFEEMNQVLRNIAVENNIPIIEIPENIAQRAPDGWHYNSSGYRKMLQYIIQESCKTLNITNHPLLDLINDPSFGFNEPLPRLDLQSLNENLHNFHNYDYLASKFYIKNSDKDLS